MSGSVWYISVSRKKLEFKKYPTQKKKKKTSKSKPKKPKNFMLFLMLVAGLVVFSNMVSAAAINDSFHINLQTTYANGSIETGTFDFAFNITESSSSSCLGPIVYNHSTSETTDTRGIVSIYLPTTGSGGGDLSALDFDKQYYLCYYRDGTLKDVSQLGRVPYSFRATQVNLSEIDIDSNLTMGSYNVSASSGFFTYLGSLLSRITKIFATDVDVSENVTIGGNLTVDGRVGIGTTSPGAPLHIKNTAASNPQVIIENTATPYRAALFHFDTGSATGYGTGNYALNIVNRYTSDGDIGLRAAKTGNVQFILKGSGNVGINTTTPQDTLNVVGDANVTGSVFSQNKNLTLGYEYAINYTGTAGIGDCPSGQFVQNTTTGGVECTAPAGGGDITGVYTTLDNYLYNGSASGDVYLRFNETYAADNLAVNSSDFWDSYDTPSEITSGDSQLLDGYNSTFFMPLNKSVYGDFDFNGSIDVDGGWISGGVTIDGGDLYAQTVYVYNITSLNVTEQNLTIVDDLIVYGNTELKKNLTVDTDTLFVDSNTDMVGIGTTSPDWKLEVLGTTGSEAISTQVGLNFDPVGLPGVPSAVTILDSTPDQVPAGDNYYMVTYITELGETSRNGITAACANDATHTSNNVTIPVSSDPRVTGRKIYRSHGDPWSDYYLATVNNNVDTTYIDILPTTSGPKNAAYSRPDTTSNFITVDGVQAMMVDAHRVLYGPNAGAALTTGGDNVLIGPNAGKGLTSGGNNVVVGNAWLGETAMYNMVIATSSSSADTLTGDGNIIIGHKVGTALTTASHNILMGLNAGYSATTGSSNTLLGYQSGYDITTGNHNFISGYQSGHTLQTGSYNIIINPYSETPATDTSYYLDIGGTIYGDLSSKKIGINTTTPQNTLNVVGDLNVTGTIYGAGGGNVSGNVTGAGTANTITKWTGSETLGDSSITDDGTIVAVDSSDLYINTTSGNVGIGTTSPGAKLDISGTGNLLRIGNSTNTAHYASFRADGSSGAFIGYDGAQALFQSGVGKPMEFRVNGSVYNSGTVAMFIEPDGNVGIGTTSPGYPLEVKGNVMIDSNSTGKYLYFYDTTNGLKLDGTASIMTMISGRGVAVILDSNNNEADTTEFRIMKNTNDPETATEVFRVQEDGKVGIGTSSPESVLHINDTDGTGLTIERGNPTYPGKWSFRPSVYAPGGSLSIAEGFTGYIKMMFASDGDFGIGHRLTNDALAGSYFMIQNSSGNVGIGTTSPVSKLEVSGTGDILKLTYDANTYLNISQNTFTSLIKSYGNHLILDTERNVDDLYLKTNGTNAVFIDATNQNVGIGTTSPATPLHVYADTTTLARFERHTSSDGFVDISLSGTDPEIIFDPGTGTTWTVGVDDGDLDKFKVLTGQDVSSGTSRLTIDANGNVGIGTASPQQTFHVNGSAVLNGTLNMDSNKIISLGNGTSAQDAVTLSQLQAVNESAVAEETDPLWTGNMSNVAFTNIDETFDENLVVTKNLTVDTDTLFVDSNTNKVGIGTTSPAAKLNINMSATDSTGGIKMIGYSNPSTDLSYWAESQFAIKYNNLYGIVFTSNGTSYLNGPGTKLGIGTTNPVDALEIVGGVGTHGLIVTASSGAATQHALIVRDSSLNQLLRVQKGGNVGIGIYSPVSNLHVNDSDQSYIIVETSGDDIASYHMKSNNVQKAVMGYYNVDDAFKISHAEAGTTLADDQFIIKEGKVGIGTTSPTYKFELGNGLTSDMIMRINKIGSSTGQIKFATAGSNEWRFEHTTGEDFKLVGEAADKDFTINVNDGGVAKDVFKIDSSEPYVLFPNGNVGIGTTSPTTKVQIHNSAYTFADTLLYGDRIALRMIDFPTGGGWARSLLQWENNSGSLLTSLGAYGVNNTFEYGYIGTAYNNYSIRWYPNNYVSLPGNVGIGTTSPGANLHIYKDMDVVTGDNSIVYIEADDAGVDASRTIGLNVSVIPSGDGWALPEVTGLHVAVRENSGNYAGIFEGGNVGIGTTNPYRKTEIVDGTGGEVLQLQLRNNATSNGTSAGIKFTLSTDSASNIGAAILANRTNVGGAGDSDLLFQTSDGTTLTTNMIINHLGNVGIGTTSPSRDLDVQGIFGVQFNDTTGYERFVVNPTAAGADFVVFDANENMDFRIDTRTGQETMWWNGAGNVGIGTTTPQNTLNVVGDLNVTGTIYGAGGGNVSDTYVPYTGALYNVDLGAHNFTVDTNVLHVDSNTNNVGIGTASPQQTLHVNGSAVLNGTLNMDSNKIISLGNGTSAQDAVTLSQLQAVNESAVAEETDPLWTGNQSSVARIGDCPEGQFVQNTTTGGVECTAPVGGGDITGVYTTLDNYLYNGSASGDVYLRFNETYAADNLAVNSSDYWDNLNTPADILGSQIQNNLNWINATYGNATYIKQENEGNLNVNSSDYWDSYNMASDLNNLLTLDWANITNKAPSDFNYLILSKWANITDAPTALSFFTDDLGNRGYTHLTNFTDDLGNRGYTHLTNFTDDILWTSGFNATGDARWLGVGDESDPLWTGNWTNVAFTNIDETFDENLVVTKNLTVDTDTLFVNSNTDRVGIGIASPTYKLDIRDATNPIMSIVDTTNNAAFFAEALDDAALVGELGGSYPFHLWVGGGTKMTLLTSGNVGINTTTPQNTLNVVGDANITGLIYGNGSQLTGISTTETDPLWTGNYTSRTGTGNVVFSTSPTLTTPNIGAATAGGTLNMNNNAITNINWSGSDDGSGSELDADTLDTHDTSYFQTAIAAGTTAQYWRGDKSWQTLLGTTSATAYRGDYGNTAYTHSQATTGSVHGSTTVGGNLLRLTNPSAIRFLRTNADNTVSALTAADFRTAIGAGTGDGTVTSVAAGDGMDFTTITTSGSVTMGTPSTLTSATSNSASGTTHTHAITNYALSGTTNQVTVTGAAKVLGAAATLSLPQDIHSGASPSFTDLSLTGGDLTITNNNGGIDFNDASAYWLKTATNWGLYWDTTANTLEFTGSGTSRAEIDLDNGNLQIDGDLDLDGGNLYDSGTTNFFNGGCSADQYVSSISSDGTINCAGDSGTGSMSYWTLTADSGTNQQVDNAEIVDIEGGTAISTSVGATNKVTVAVTADSIGNTQLEFDTGQALTTGSSPTFTELTITPAQVIGGFGAETTSGTLNWSHVTNARSGNGYTLLYGNAADGPGPAVYFHPFSFEYSSKDGSGNMNQLAIPYTGIDYGPYYRTRYNGGWSSWAEMWTSGNDGSGSGLDADKLDGSEPGSLSVNYATTAGGAPPTGTAGGALSGTYPNPGVNDTDCPAESVLMGDGACDTKASFGDGTGTDDQTLAEVLTAGNDANMNIDMADNSIQDLANLYKDDSSTNFFSGGASASQTVTGISSAGVLSTTAIAISESAVSGEIEGIITTATTSGLDGGCASGTCTLTVDASDLTDTTNDGITTSGENFVVSGGTCLTADASGLGVTGDCIGDTQLAYNTGQHLTTSSSPTFVDLNSIRYIYGDYGTIAASYDEWLRLNDGSGHTNGVYVPTKLRADGGLYVSDDEYWYAGAEDRIDTTDNVYLTATTYLGTTSTYFDTSGNLDLGNKTISDVWKITINTGGAIDPPYRVGDTVYSTYSPFMVGSKEEVTGTVMLNSNYVIDFKNLERGSDLWLFYQVTDFGENWENLQVMLTPSFDGKVWYEKDPREKILTIHGDQAGEVSYRMTANSWNWKDWSNVASGVDINNYLDMGEKQ